MNKLQTKLLEMFSWLTRFLSDNNLRYYVVGGTMLGAVRHKGFIPWDDDIDIAMPRKDYERLIDLFSQDVEHYVVESVRSDAKDFCYSFVKFYDASTTMTEQAKRKIKRGVYIDIFPLDGIGQTIEQSIQNYKKIDRLNMLLAMKACKLRKGRKWWKNIAALLGCFLPISEKKLSVKLDRVCSAIDFDESVYVGQLMSTYRRKEIMEKEIYGTPTLYDFENIKVYGPEKYDEYLTRIYGDWRKLPPIEKRVTAHDFIELNLNKSYREK